MRTERRVPGWRWQLAILAVFAGSCRFIEEDRYAQDRSGVVEDSARYVQRDRGERPRDREYPTLVPVLECVETIGRGTLRAHFGYENSCRDELYLPVGDHNRFRPSPKDRNQPIYFEPGTRERVVSVTFDASESVSWVLEDGEALADADSPRCKDSSEPQAKGCGDPKRCPADDNPKPKDAGAPTVPPPAKPACSSCDAGCVTPRDNDKDKRDAAPPAPHDAGCGCEDAGAAPSDKQCPKNAQFEASCVGPLRCGPYSGPLHAKCSSVSCCGQVESFTVPLPTLANCIDGSWTLSIDPEDSTDVCGAPRLCSCSGEHE